MDRLGAMQIVVAIADRGTLTSAAEALNLSLPAVARRLAALETRMGIRLFNRTTRRIAATDEGRLFIDRCRTVLAAVRDAETALIDRRTSPRGALTVTASELLGRRFIAPVAAGLVAGHPELAVQLLLTDRVVNLVEEGIDIAIRVGALSDSSLVAQRLGEVRRVVCASPDYLRRHGAPRVPADLAAHRCVSFTAVTPTDEWRFPSGAVRVPLAFACNQVDAAMQACIEGLGPGVFLSYHVAEARADGRLAYILEDHEPATLPVNVVYPHARHRSAAVRVFVEACRERLAAARLA